MTRCHNRLCGADDCETCHPIQRHTCRNCALRSDCDQAGDVDGCERWEEESENE